MSDLDSDQRLAERVVDAMMAADAFSRWLGIKVLAVRPREATVAMMVRDEMVNGFGVSHGGVVYALADSALAFASNTHGRVTVSIENSITYPQPVRVGDELIAKAEEEGASNRLGYYRVTVTRRDGTVVGLFRGTVYKTKTDFFSRDVAAGSGE
ncbi:MAG TPA: hydroxyphenylacetyl-CoA thioesterase PaaI [Gemmatimonadaceae bacterium]|jgi:acyl-CoA thioesterase